MRFENLSPLAFFGLAASHAIQVRAPAEAAVAASSGDRGSSWRPHTRDPHFFNLRVNDRCDPFATPPETDRSQCPFDSYAIRLEQGIFVATPYTRWYDPKLPTFFVDDDTQMYTVSKDPLQVYIDSVTGAVKYTKVGWLPPSAISTGFYHTGNNPIQLVDPSPSFLTWPSTIGNTMGEGDFALCALGATGQFQVFVNIGNFPGQGVTRGTCASYQLAALNANPWRRTHLKARGGYPTSDNDGYSTSGGDSGDSWGDDSSNSWGDDSGDSWGDDSGYKTSDPGYDTWKKDDDKSWGSKDDSYETKDPGYSTSDDWSYKKSDDGYDTSDDGW